MSHNILIRPVVSEKASKLGEKKNQFVFVVNRKANKIEIQKAVEQMYSVQVESVNTLVRPGKVKSRSTKKAVLKGQTSPQKRAIVRLVSGETIDFLANAEQSALEAAEE